MQINMMMKMERSNSISELSFQCLRASQLTAVNSGDMEIIFEPVVRIIKEMISKQVEKAVSSGKTPVTVCAHPNWTQRL